MGSSERPDNGIDVNGNVPQSSVDYDGDFRGDDFKFYSEDMLKADLETAIIEQKKIVEKLQADVPAPFPLLSRILAAAVTIIPLLVVLHRCNVEYVPMLTVGAPFFILVFIVSVAVVAFQSFIINHNENLYRRFKLKNLILSAVISVFCSAAIMVNTRLLYIPLVVISALLLAVFYRKYDTLSKMLLVPFSAIMLLACIQVQDHCVMWVREIGFSTDSYYISNFSAEENGETDDNTHHFAYCDCSEEKLSFCRVNEAVFRSAEEFHDAVFNYSRDRYGEIDNRVIIPMDEHDMEVPEIFAEMMGAYEDRYDSGFFETYDLIVIGSNYYRRDDRPQIVKIELNRDMISFYITKTTSEDENYIEGDCRLEICLIAVPKEYEVPSSFSRVHFEEV